MVGNAARDFMNSMDRVCDLMKDNKVAADIKFIAQRMNLINSVRDCPASVIIDNLPIVILAQESSKPQNK